MKPLISFIPIIHVDHSRRKRLIEEIIEAVDENENTNVKLSFYTDAFVDRCIKKAYKEWEKEGGKGIPLEYLNDEELKELHEKAIFYRDNPIQFSYSEIMTGIRIEERNTKRGGFGSKIFKVFKKAFISSG